MGEIRALRRLRPGDLDSQSDRRSTFFLTGQVFWQYVPASTSRFQGQVSARDKVRNWEMVDTIATSMLYLRGKLLPTAF